MTDAGTGHSAPTLEWRRLWHTVSALAAAAVRLRHLSQREPLAQHRPGYPRPGLTHPHDADVRDVLETIQQGLEDIATLAPEVVPAGAQPGMGADERRDELVKRAAVLRRLAATLATEAFQPLPPLPKHAPPYTVEPPGHELPGTKAVLIAAGLESLTMSLRNLMLSAANREPPGPASPS